MTYCAESPSTWTFQSISLPQEGKPSLGFVAQELYEVLPEAVSKPVDETKEFWSVKEVKLIPILVNAVQELKRENEFLKQNIEALNLNVGKLMDMVNGK